MKYNEYKGLDLPKVTEDILAFWKSEDVFAKSIETREGNENFTFYEGPPSANGAPGIHHVMARAIKDIFCRYKTLKGFQVKRKGGWDTHGLPVELQVEKELGITKEDIGTKISVAEYNKKCRETVMRFKAQWDELTEKMGYWADLDDPYITFENNYIESLWNLLKRLHDKGMLYKGYTIQPYSPAAGTGLSSHELNLPGCYRDVKDTSVVAQFKVQKDGAESLFDALNEGESLYILAWTTTPWTLPSNAALAVGEKIEYKLIRTFNSYTFEPIVVVAAADLVGKYFSKKQFDADFGAYESGAKLIPAQEVASVKGADLVGVRYEQLMPYVQPEGDAFRVIAGDFVSTEDGTGIVHIAPTFGADDKRVADLAGVPPIVVKDSEGNELPLVNKKGQLVEEVTDFALRYVKEYEPLKEGEKPTDVDIAILLKEQNKAFKVEKYEHSYPHCWRTDKPVLYYPMESWFIKTTAVRERMVELNKTINWKPESTGTGRFGNWLENLVDWNLSRSRYWGTPLPIWRTEDGKEEICIGSIEELKAEIDKAVAAGVETRKDLDDLHRPYVDEVVLVSPTGKPMHREADLIDVWFDSGAMPFAQWHYPFENTDVQKGAYPADFISEGVDQTRGWFFTLHAISVMLEDSVAFKNVVSTGLVLDAKGNKMSKRLGNAVNPFDTIGKYGSDATRWYMIENSSPWDNLKFNTDGLDEVRRKFFGTLYNTYSFFVLYANLDGFTYQDADLPIEERAESDQWILSKLNSLIAEVDSAYNDYEPTKAARAMQSFVIDDMSNWYVRLNRKRFWKPSEEAQGLESKDKLSAYQTLYTCLETISKLMSPIAPFYADRLFLDLNGVTGKEKVTSVHLSDFPKVDESLVNKSLEERMGLAQTVSSLVHSIRKNKRLKVRQPLSRVLIPDLNEALTAQIRKVEPIILSEVNIKKIDFLDDENVIVKKIKPNFPVLGKKGLGKLMKPLQNYIRAMSAEDIAALESSNALNVDLDGQTVALTLEDVIIESDDIPGWSIAKDGGITVALDITVDEELKLEGIARDLVNRIQNLRKDKGFDVQDKINVKVDGKEEQVAKALTAFDSYICNETQALSIETAATLAEPEEVDLDGLVFGIEVMKA